MLWTSAHGQNIRSQSCEKGQVWRSIKYQILKKLNIEVFISITTEKI
jgi:hypothetical protein